MEEQQTRDSGRTEPQRKGWDILALFFILHAVIGAKVSTLGSRRPAAVGDPMSLWVGLFFGLWGVACLVASRAEDRSVLFRVLNGTKAASFLGWIFLASALYLLARYAGIV